MLFIVSRILKGPVLLTVWDRIQRHCPKSNLPKRVLWIGIILSVITKPSKIILLVPLHWLRGHNPNIHQWMRKERASWLIHTYGIIWVPMTKALMSLDRIIYSTRLSRMLCASTIVIKAVICWRFLIVGMVTHVCLKVINGQVSLL